jgi:hypothetical protein
MLSPEDYAAASGTCCPACGGTDLEWRDYDQADPASVTRAWRCENCGATWRAVYELTGYKGLCQPRKETR